MTQAPRPHPDMDAFLDGTLDPARRQAFEQRLAADPDLRTQVQLQRDINASLARLFAYDAARPAADQPAPPAPIPIAHARPRRRLALLGVAAALLGGVFVLMRSTSGDGLKHQTPAAFYATLEHGGWKPSWACETEEQFARAVANQFQLTQSSLLVPFDTPGVQLVGWGYGNSYKEGTPLSERCLTLLTHVEGQRVLVLMDKPDKDRRLSIPSSSNLKIFRREAAGLVLYEITPLGMPRVLNAAVAVPVPPRQPADAPPSPPG